MRQPMPDSYYLPDRGEPDPVDCPHCGDTGYIPDFDSLSAGSACDLCDCDAGQLAEEIEADSAYTVWASGFVRHGYSRNCPYRDIFCGAHGEPCEKCEADQITAELAADDAYQEYAC